MRSLNSDAVILRTWPIQEADLIVSFLTRDYGRVRGIAKSALKSRKRFGGALEPTTLAHAWFVEKPRQELVRLDQLEILRSPLSAPVTPTRMAILSLIVEALDEALPEHDPQPAAFRLAASVLEQATGEQPWMALTYFMLWLTRLTGILPDLAHCLICSEPLHPEAVYFQSHADGLFCPHHAAPGASQLMPDSWTMAQRMLRAPVATFAADPWPRRRGHDLRRIALGALERHFERKLRSAEALARLNG